MSSTPDSESVEWYPAQLFLGYPGFEFVFIILNQPIQDPLLFDDLWSTGMVNFGGIAFCTR
jgi:hypothetical protein